MELLTVKEVAQILRISRQAVHKKNQERSAQNN